MIQSSDISRKVEHREVHPFPLKYDSIKPETSIDEKEAHDFWDTVFYEPVDVHQITEADILNDVYGRVEDEFEFDFDVSSSKMQEAIDKFRSSTWDLLSPKEREEACKEFTLAIAEKLAIENPPSIEFYEAEPCDCGAFETDRNCIKINRNNFDDSQEIVNTVSHEIRHAYQYQMALNPESYIDLLYAYNFTHYITPYVDENGYVNFIDYQDQLIEAEARAFANLFKLEDGRDE